MKIKLRNNNMIEVRDLLSTHNIKPNNDLTYHLLFGFKSDEEEYIFELEKVNNAIKIKVSQ